MLRRSGEKFSADWSWSRRARPRPSSASLRPFGHLRWPWRGLRAAHCWLTSAAISGRHRTGVWIPRRNLSGAEQRCRQHLRARLNGLSVDAPDGIPAQSAAHRDGAGSRCGTVERPSCARAALSEDEKPGRRTPGRAIARCMPRSRRRASWQRLNCVR